MAKPNEQAFLKNVEKHEMTVVLDSGIHRHLRFRQKSTSTSWFEIVTWPGCLAYSGDMGSFTFRRLEDMFKFFRTDQDETAALRINPQYWAEKIVAVDRDGGSRSSHVKYSEEKMRQHIEDAVRSWIEDWDLNAGQTRSLRNAVHDDVLNRIEDGEDEAREAVRDFSFEGEGHTFQFSDSWEWNCDEYTYRFLWCCYALAWAIRQYDIHKAATADAGVR